MWIWNACFRRLYFQKVCRDKGAIIKEYCLHVAWRQTHRSLVFPAEKTSWLKAPWVWAVYGLVNPPAEPGHGCIHPWKPWISTAISPRDQAVDPSITHQRPSGVPLEHHDANISVKHWIMDNEVCQLVVIASTLHASFPPILDPAQIMFVVMFPLKESLLLHLEVETMGSLTVRRVRGFRPPLWLVEPHPDTRHILPASSPVFCLGSGASDTYLFSSIGALSWKNPHPETDIQIRAGMKAHLTPSNCYTIHYKA